MMMFFFVLLVLFSLYTVNLFKSEYDQQNSISRFSENVIAVVELNGIILDSKDTVDLLKKAENSPNVKAIILRINSPGGAVGPSQEIYEEVRRIDSAPKDKGGLPVYASMGTIAASGGYYIASAARTIFASKGTLTGSIGVIMELLDLSELYKLAKVSPEIIKAGKYKDAGNPSRKLTNEERKLMTNTINKVHQQFIDDILSTRKDRIVGDIKEMAQGQVFSGEEAKELGLIDEIGGLWAAGRFVSKKLEMEDLELKFIKKSDKKGIWKFLDGLEEATSFIEGLKTYFHQSPVLMYK